MNRPSHAGKSLQFCSLFESELLVRLMLLNWQHPNAGDEDYSLQLLESANELLANADQTCEDSTFIDGMNNGDMNLVSAGWYCEQVTFADSTEEPTQRQHWLDAVRRALPSCFCDPNDLEMP